MESKTQILSFPLGAPASHIQVHVDSLSGLHRRRGREAQPPLPPIVRAEIDTVDGELSGAHNAGPVSRRPWRSAEAVADILGNVMWSEDASKRLFVAQEEGGAHKLGDEGKVTLLRCKVFECRLQEGGQLQGQNDESMWVRDHLVGECLVEIPSSINVGETRMITTQLESTIGTCARVELRGSPLKLAGYFKETMVEVVHRLIVLSFGEGSRKTMQDRVGSEHGDSGRASVSRSSAGEDREEGMGDNPAEAPDGPATTPQPGASPLMSSGSPQAGMPSVPLSSTAVSPLTRIERDFPEEYENSGVIFAIARAKAAAQRLVKRLPGAGKPPEAAESAEVELKDEDEPILTDEALALAAKAKEPKEKRAAAAAQEEEKAAAAIVLMLWRGVLQLRRSVLSEIGCRLPCHLPEDIPATVLRCSEEVRDAENQIQQAENELDEALRSASRPPSQSSRSNCSRTAGTRSNQASDAGSMSATPPTTPPVGKGYRRAQQRRKYPDDNTAVIMGDATKNEIESHDVESAGEDRHLVSSSLQLSEGRITNARRALADAQAVHRDALRVLQDAGVSLDMKTAEFAGVRLKLKITGVGWGEDSSEMQAGSVANDYSVATREFSEADRIKLDRDRIKVDALGVLRCRLSSKKMIWQQPYQPPPLPGDKARMQLQVKIIEAEHLPKMDQLGKVDPYVVLTCSDQRQSTSVQNSTYSPEWGECFYFDLGEASRGDVAGEIAKQVDDMLLVVMDHDNVGEHDTIGTQQCTRNVKPDLLFTFQEGE